MKKLFILMAMVCGALVGPGRAAYAEDTIGVSVPVLANPFWQRYTGFVQQVAEQLNLKVNIVDCQNQEAKQLQDIENLIASGVKGLIVTPQTAQVGPQIIARARKANIPIAITDRWPGIDPTKYDWDGFVGFIGPDDEDAGYRIAKALMAAGKKNIVGIVGVHGASVAEGRYAGLAKAMKENTSAKLLDAQWVGETADLGISTMENYLAAHGDKIDAVWNYNDALATGAVKALRDRGLSDALLSRKVVVGGMDLNPDAVDLIKQGYYYTSFGGHWLQGGFGLIMLHDYMKGKKPEAKYRVARLKLMQVTKENVDKFTEQFVNNPPQIDARKISRALNPSASGQYFFEIAIK
ncbi:MAG TPA: substrate-binding domain-containing protein [Rectinemataceae bacterium]|nr:substrate-binding domain-containing protein [Rectinemataceae bacterium]